MLGFWAVEENEFGPAHTWLVPPVDEDVRFIGLPTVTGELLLTVTPVGGLQTVGAGLTTTLVVAVAVQVPDELIVTV